MGLLLNEKTRLCWVKQEHLLLRAVHFNDYAKTKQAPIGACLYFFALQLPAGLDQTRYITTHCCFTQLVAAQSELAVYTVRTACYAAAIAQARSAGIARLLLQSNLCIPLLFVGRLRIGNNCLDGSTLFSVFGNRLLALELAVDH